MIVFLLSLYHQIIYIHVNLTYLQLFHGTLFSTFFETQAAMEEQLRKLKLAMAAANSPFTELKEGLKDHLEHVKNACAAHAKQKIVVAASVANVVAMIQEHHMDATGGAATGSSF